MTDDPIDLSSLDPRTDRDHDLRVSRIVADGLAARRVRAAAPESVLGQLERWWRPALVAAALILAVSIPTAIRSGRDLAGVSAVAFPPDRWGLPATVARLVQSDQAPTVIDIVAAFNTRWLSVGE
jgi:hypothetical protein